MTSTMRFDKWENSIGQPYSAVLQVVNASYSTEIQNTSTTYAATGLAATITPKFASSKILVVSNQVGMSKWVNGNVYNNISVQLRRDSAALCTISDLGYNESTGFFFGLAAPMTVLDTPNTTGAITYAVFFKNNQVSSDCRANRGATSTITLMEIAQ